jgi:hypothetical protein
MENVCNSALLHANLPSTDFFLDHWPVAVNTECLPALYVVATQVSSLQAAQISAFRHKFLMGF